MSLEHLISDKVFLLVVVILTALLYHPLNRRKSKHYWELKIDIKIPLIPIFIIPYIYFFFPYIILSVIFLWQTPVILDFLKSFIAANLLASVIWYLFPNGVKRPQIESVGFLKKMVSDLYKIDKYETNGFPSGHVYTSAVITWYFVLAFPQYLFLFMFIGISIILSTLFVKQHYIVDVIGGLAIAAFSIIVVGL